MISVFLKEENIYYQMVYYTLYLGKANQGIASERQKTDFPACHLMGYNPRSFYFKVVKSYGLQGP